MNGLTLNIVPMNSLSLHTLEESFDNLFVRRAPALPVSSKKTLVQYLPWINLLLGIITLGTVYDLWHWIRITDSLIGITRSLHVTYSGSEVPAAHQGFGIWLGLAVLAVEALLYLAAFPGTRDRKKSGWRLMFYALLANVLYGVIILFTYYGTVWTLAGTLVGSGVGLYLLFQIRSSYSAKGTAFRKKS